MSPGHDRRFYSVLQARAVFNHLNRMPLFGVKYDHAYQASVNCKTGLCIPPNHNYQYS